MNLPAACGAIAALGAYKSRPGIVLLSGLAALLLVGYAFVAIPGEEYAENINGGAGIPVDLGDPIQVGYAWGIFVLLGAAITLVTTGGVMRSHER